MEKEIDIIHILLSFIIGLLGIIAFFLKRHLTKSDLVNDKVDNHEVRISVLEKK